MKKSDLKTGMWVEYRYGDKRMVALNTSEGDVLVGTEHGCSCLRDFGEDLLHKRMKDMDIVAVHQPLVFKDIMREDKALKIWERKETIEMTLQEAMQKLKEVTGKSIKIII